MLEKICEWDRAYTAGFRHTNHAIPEIHFFWFRLYKQWRNLVIHTLAIIILFI